MAEGVRAGGGGGWGEVEVKEVKEDGKEQKGRYGKMEKGIMPRGWGGGKNIMTPL